jgi:hypothetical protein
MRNIGFSTGALACGDFRRAIHDLRDKALAAVELSALRETELPGLMAAISGLPLSTYRYVSVHAPSRFVSLTDADVLALLQPVLVRRWPIIVHPDVIRDFAAWRQIGSLLCIENMDGRKPIGRDVPELTRIFELLPNASFCLDLGHAHQIDPSMGLARHLLQTFFPRLCQLHLSHVASDFTHHRLSDRVIADFQRAADLIPQDAPVILESPVPAEEIAAEVAHAQNALAVTKTAVA